MKPRYLSFCGINSFSEPVEIDFSELLASGLFGIFGDTGSGKSTILDCISLALYGGTPRVRTGLSDIINTRLDRAYVHFEFEIYFEGERKVFRIERELKRKNSAQTLKVIELREGGETLVRAEGVTSGEAFLKGVVGLEQKDFEKCISLPQGEFAQFVKAAPSERLKLVSRLFDLEKYGERLVKRANIHYRECAAEAEIARTRLEPYAEISAENNARLEEETRALEEEELSSLAALAKAREGEALLSERYKKRLEREKVTARLALLREKEGEISSLEHELSRLSFAAEISRAEGERAAAEKEEKSAAASLQRAQSEKEEAERLLDNCLLWDGEKAQAELDELTVRKTKAEQAEAERRRREELERKLSETRRKFAEERDLFKGFSYETERAELEKALQETGEGDFLSFIETHGKAELLRGEYATFAGELKEIGEKYPETEEDISPLVEKYTRLSEGEREGFDLRAQFETLEKRRKELQEARLSLEQRNARYTSHLQRLQQLQTEGSDLKERLLSLGGAEEGEKSDALSLIILEKKRERKRRLEELESARKKSALCASAFAAAAERKNAAQTRLRLANERLGSALLRGKFSSAEEAAALMERFGRAEDAEERVKRFREEYAALRARAEELPEDPDATLEALEHARQEAKELENRSREVSGQLALKRRELSAGKEALSRKSELEREASARKREAEIAERLKKLFEANKFMEFIAEEYLQNIAQNASARLLSLTSGKYFLRYEGGFFVGDNLNGGALRGVHTLSGGEVFLVSLSLALALSAEICARSSRPMEFFFLDEGFGTLDTSLVDTVMDSLEKLRSEHFAIGIISHVEELKHRIEKKISVEKATDSRGSQIHS